MLRMHQNIIDLKASLALGLYAFVSFSNAEMAMKIIAFIVTVGYTGHRWYILLKERNKPKNED